MENKSYHHGNLKNELIEKGIELISEQGYSNFSIRKLAGLAGVSANACYNHFKDKEDLYGTIKEYVRDKLAETLSLSYSETDEYPLICMGAAYVDFFAKYPKYFPFIFDKGDYQINLDEENFTGNLKAFKIFKDCALKDMQKHGIPEEKRKDNLIVMWAVVQGLSAMTNMQGFHYNGEWKELTRRLLAEKINVF